MFNGLIGVGEIVLIGVILLSIYGVFSLAKYFMNKKNKICLYIKNCSLPLGKLQF